MNKIQCEVTGCSHNKSNICYANRVNIGGKTAQKDDQTCCGSFLNRLLYSDLTNNTNAEGSCDCLVCYVNTCKFNENCFCSLDAIQVGGASAEIYAETICKSFENK